MRPLLPPDYASLDPKAKHAARIAAYSRSETPEAFEAAHGLFSDLCLGRKKDSPLPEGFFYRDMVPGPIPEFHRQIIRDIGRWPKVMIQWPRAAAKSTVIQSMVIWLALTRKIEVMIVCITEGRVSEIMDDISYQLRNNPVIRSEFGEVHARRHEGLWSHKNITLRNRSKIRVICWKSASLTGKRPQLIIIDDIEHHSASNRDPEATCEKLDDWFFSMIHPMLEKKAAIVWISTLSRRDFYSYKVAKVSLDDDPRWRFWRRTTLGAEWFDPDTGERRLLWPQKWSAEFLDAQKIAMGPAKYAAQFLNEPGDEGAALFRLDERYHLYSITRMTPDERKELHRQRDAMMDQEWIPRPLEPWDDSNILDRPHPSLDPEPLTSDVIVNWSEPSKDGRDRPEPRSDMASDLWASCFRMITVDFASTTGVQSDYSGCMCHGFDPQNRQWVLDLWLGKKSEEELLRRTYDMARRWRVQLVCIEDVGRQSTLRERARTMMVNMAQAGDHAFIIGGTEHRSKSKGDRIAGIEWRFASNCIFFPAERRADPVWRQLFEQVRLFTPDLSLLEHDDAVDMLAMPANAKGKCAGSRPGGPKPLTVEEQLLRGKSVNPKDGDQWGLCSQPTAEISAAARARRMRKPGKKGGLEWMRP